MSRLYGTMRSDTRKTELTTRGHQTINANLLWGSRSDSKLAVRTSIEWRKDREKPTLYIFYDSEITDVHIQTT